MYSPSVILRHPVSFTSVNIKMGIEMYRLTRSLKPSIVLETGVHHGMSSAFTLRAMHDNHHGALYSIDLPNATEQLKEGWSTGDLIPGFLRNRWHLILGDSRERLPALLQRLKQVDIFFHDSLHTYNHMMFEYRTAWPYVRKGLFSDDLWPHWVECRQAFVDFSKEIGVDPEFRLNGRLGILMKTKEAN